MISDLLRFRFSIYITNSKEVIDDVHLNGLQKTCFNSINKTLCTKEIKKKKLVHVFFLVLRIFSLFGLKKKDSDVSDSHGKYM